MDAVHFGGNGYGECGVQDAVVTKSPALVTCPTCRGWLPIVAPLDPNPVELSEHDRRNAECRARLAAQMAQRERSLLVVSLEPGLHRSRRNALVYNIGDLPGVELVANVSNLPLPMVEEILARAEGGLHQ